MNVIPRSGWGAVSPKWRTEGNLNDPSTGHWNGPTITLSGKTTWDHSKCASILRGIQSFHMNTRNWSDIAYNFAVCPHRYIFELRGLDVINGANGTNDGNRSSHAILFIAGEGNPFPESEKQAFRECIRFIADRTSAPDKAIGHRDHKSTACPGDARYNWIHKGMPVQTESEIIMFHKNTDYKALVETMYTKIAGRKVESTEVRDSWAYRVALAQGLGYMELETALLYEVRVREQSKHNKQQNEINALRADINNLEPASPLPEFSEEQILETVYKDLIEKLGSD